MNLRDKDTIVFAGDSVTDAEKLTTEDGLGRGYVKLVRDALIAFRPAEEYRVINAGVNGNTSRELLARWEKDVSEKKPDILFCMNASLYKYSFNIRILSEFYICF